VARDIPALYDTIASQVVDRLVEFGEARVSNVPDTELLRAAVRRTARRRSVKLLSRTLRDGFVIVVATEPGVEAEAYQTVTSALLPDAMDRLRRTGKAEPLGRGRSARAPLVRRAPGPRHSRP
jgi:hypothetical protein